MSDLVAYRIDVEAYRGDQVESRHTVFCAARDTGDLALEPLSREQLPRTSWRSAAKPFQLLPLLVIGGRDRFELDEADLAVMAASHDGTDEHAGRVGAILERAGLGPGHLQCGVHRPYYLERLSVQSPENHRDFGPLHNNCSGNHAAMLLLAQMHGVDLAHYLDPESPSQRTIHAVVEALCGVTPKLAIDNCRSPCYGLSLASMVEAYAFLARPRGVRDLAGARCATLEGVAPLERFESGLEEIAVAMARKPQWVSGSGTPETRLARQVPSGLVLKNGAEGVLCVAHRRSGAAVALKVADGNARALIPVLMFLMMRWGWILEPERTQLADLVEPVLRGRTGEPVGRLRVAVAGA